MTKYEPQVLQNVTQFADMKEVFYFQGIIIIKKMLLGWALIQHNNCPYKKRRASWWIKGCCANMSSLAQISRTHAKRRICQQMCVVPVSGESGIVEWRRANVSTSLTS